MSSLKELYFCLMLTENEHYIVCDYIKDYCNENGLELRYYRKYKLGHIPMWREVKIIGTRSKLKAFKTWATSKAIGLELQNHYDFIDESSPWTVKQWKEHDKKLRSSLNDRGNF